MSSVPRPGGQDVLETEDTSVSRMRVGPQELTEEPEGTHAHRSQAWQGSSQLSVQEGRNWRDGSPMVGSQGAGLWVARGNQALPLRPAGPIQGTTQWEGRGETSKYCLSFFIF